MVLTDREIEIALSQKHIIVDPIPDLKSALSSTSLDLTLSNRFSEWASKPGFPVQPGVPGYTYDNTSHLRNELTQSRYILKPHHFVLAWTAEYVELPLHSKIAARVEGEKLFS